jgi:hypothetical protein
MGLFGLAASTRISRRNCAREKQQEDRVFLTCWDSPHSTFKTRSFNSAMRHDLFAGWQEQFRMVKICLVVEPRGDPMKAKW